MASRMANLNPQKNVLRKVPAEVRIKIYHESFWAETVKSGRHVPSLLLALEEDKFLHKEAKYEWFMIRRQMVACIYYKPRYRTSTSLFRFPSPKVLLVKVPDLNEIAAEYVTFTSSRSLIRC